MNKTKKLFLSIWIINIITIVGIFCYGRITNDNFLEMFEFKYIKIVLLIYMIYDYFKFNLANNKIDSKIIYFLCILICIIFIFAGITFLIDLNYYRISEFLFFILLSILFRLLSISSKVPDYLSLKEK